MRTKTKSQPPALFIKNQAGEDAPSLEGLHNLLTSLHHQTKPVSKTQLRQLIDLLEFLWLTLQIERDQHTRGRREAFVILGCAADVLELHEKHGIKVPAAVSAMVRQDVGTNESRRKLAQKIERAYRKLKRKNQHGISANPRNVKEALSRINPKRK